MMSARPARLADHPLNERQSHGTPGKIGKGCGLDADREHVDPNRPVGDDEIEIVAVQSTFAREVTAEIEGVIAGLEADEIVFAERWNETLVVGQRRQYFWRRARDVKEKADAVLMSALAQCLGERHQMIIMHPDEVIRALEPRATRVRSDH